MLRPHGGERSAFIDSVQVLAVWSYLLVTPMLCVLTWRLRKAHAQRSVTNVVVLGIWLLVLVGSTFVHF